jgi:type IV secretory pathway VirB2 component (pilin)
MSGCWRGSHARGTRLRYQPTKRRHVLAAPAIIAVLAVLCTPAVAFAAGAGGGASMPWTGPLQTLLDNLSGPTARIVAGLGFVIGGGIWAFSRSEEGAKRFGQIVIGAAIAIGAANIVTSLAFVGAVV